MVTGTARLKADAKARMVNKRFIGFMDWGLSVDMSRKLRPSDHRWYSTLEPKKSVPILSSTRGGALFLRHRFKQEDEGPSPCLGIRASSAART